MPYAKEVVAVLAEAGCFISEALKPGPTTGPFDWQYVADERLAGLRLPDEKNEGSTQSHPWGREFLFFRN